MLALLGFEVPHLRTFGGAESTSAMDSAAIPLVSFINMGSNIFKRSVCVLFSFIVMCTAGGDEIDGGKTVDPNTSAVELGVDAVRAWHDDSRTLAAFFVHAKSQ